MLEKFLIMFKSFAGGGVIFFCLCVPEACLANQSYVEEYGKELTGVPFAYRYHFQKETGKIWREASIEERSRFIDQIKQQEQIKKQQDDQRDMLEQQSIDQAQRSKQYEQMLYEQNIQQRKLVKEQRKIYEEQRKHRLKEKTLQQKIRIEQMRQQQERKRSR